LKAQEPVSTTNLTLQECVKTALERNLDLKQLMVNEEIQSRNLIQSKYEFLPSLSAFWNYSINWGTTINTVTFTRSTSQTNFSSPRISANVPVFTGLGLRYAVKENEQNLLAAHERMLRRKNDILNQVVASFMQIVFDKNNIKVQQNRIVVLEKQKERIQKLFNAGATTPIELSNINSQLATEQLNLLNIQNQLERDKLNLLQILQLPLGPTYIFVEPDVSKVNLQQVNIPDLQSVLTYALENMPQMKEQRLTIGAAEWRIKRAKASLYPTVSAFGTLSSQYSSQVNRFITPENRTGYFAQVDDNFQQTIGLQVQIPIFTAFRNRNNYQVAQLNKQVAKIGYEAEQNRLTQEIQQAWLAVKLARTRLDAVEEQIKALKLSFEIAEKQYNAGTLNFYAYNETLNNLTRAEFDKIQAQYELIFRMKILDVYQGIEVQF
jgi:outer membrane protein